MLLRAFKLPASATAGNRTSHSFPCQSRALQKVPPNSLVLAPGGWPIEEAAERFWVPHPFGAKGADVRFALSNWLLRYPWQQNVTKDLPLVSTSAKKFRPLPRYKPQRTSFEYPTTDHQKFLDLC